MTFYLKLLLLYIVGSIILYIYAVEIFNSALSALWTSPGPTNPLSALSINPLSPIGMEGGPTNTLVAGLHWHWINRNIMFTKDKNFISSMLENGDVESSPLMTILICIFSLTLMS